VTGTTTTGAFTITFAGAGLLRNMPQISATVIDLLATATPITITMATGTAGVTLGLWGAYDGAKVATPVAPTVASLTSGSSFTLLASYIVAITHLTAQGETLLSPGVPVILTTSDRSIRVTPATLPAGTTGVNVYINGVFAATAAQTAAAAIDIAAMSAVAHALPVKSTAFTDTSGLSIARAIAMCDIRTNNMGQVAEAASGQQPRFGVYDPTAAAYKRGAFQTSELVTNGSAGITQDALDDLRGRLLSGSLTSGVVLA